MVQRDNVNESLEAILHKESYTPEELSDLTGIGLHTIRAAAYAHELKALIVENDIISIHRTDALAWLNAREDVVLGE